MPQYQVTNNKKYKWLSLANEDKLNEWLKKNPKWIRAPFLGAPSIGDPIGLGITKPPADFMKRVIGKVKEAHPRGGALERRFHIPREW